MMKRFLLLLVILAWAVGARAQNDYTATPNLGLKKPKIGSTNGGIYINQNFDTLDAAIGVFHGGFVNVPFSTTPVFDMTKGNTFALTLSGSVASSSVNQPGVTSGQILYMIICQNSTGGFAFVFPPNFQSVAPVTVSPNANVCSASTWIWDGIIGKWVNVSSAGAAAGVGAPLPFTVIPFTATPAFSATLNAAYGITLTGNVTSSSVTGSPVNGVIMKLHICQGAGGPWTFAFPASFLNTTTIQTTGCTDETFSFDGTNWSQLTQPAGGGGGGGGNCSSSGNQGTIQAAGTAGACQSTNLSESSGVLTVGDDQIPLGPNPYVDIRKYGAAVVSGTSPPNTTGTISSGTNSLVVASPTGFAKTYGVAIVGAGAAQTMTTPIAPTVTPSCAASLTGLGITVPAGAGGTTYPYSIAGIDAARGWTAASATTTITNGNATLGSNTTGWTSSTSGVANTFTAQVTSTSNLAAGCVVFMTGSTDDGEFGGWKVIASIVDGTHFTYTSGVDAARGITTTTATGGTVYFWLCNHIVLPTPTTGITQYLIYSGSNLRAISLPANLGYADSGYNTWDDYGSPMSDNSLWPWWAPLTPPSSPVNDMLVTTITNIAGTTFTLADNAGTSVTTSPLQFDDVPAIKAAVAASNCFTTGCGGSIHFPAIPRVTGVSNPGWVISSPLTLTVPSVYVDGSIYFHDTFRLIAGTVYGTYADARSQSQVAFSPRSHVTIFDRGAMPTTWIDGGINDVNIFFNRNGGVGIFHTTQSSFPMDNVGFGDISPNLDYMNMAFYDYQSSNSGGFGGHITNTSYALGPAQVTGATSTPVFASKFNYQWIIEYNTWSRRGIFLAPQFAGLIGKIFMGQEVQGPIMPFVTLASIDSGNKGGAFTFENMWIDSSATPLVANLSSTGSLGIAINIINTNMPGTNVSAAPLITGKTFDGAVNVFGATVATGPVIYKNIGQNRNISLYGSNNSSALNPGISTSALNLTTIAYTANHTLTPQEGVVIATASGITFTLPHVYRGQGWDILNQSAGTITVAIDSGTLSGGGATGPITLPANTAVHATCDGTNCSVGGLGGSGGGSPGGTVNALQSNNGAGGFQGTNSPVTNGSYLCGFNVVASASVPPTCNLPGVPINPQTGTTYTYLYSDRGTVVTANNAGAQTYTLVNPSTTGFGVNYFNVLKNIGTGAVTEGASGFTVNGGASLLVPPSWTRFLWSDGVNYTASRLPDFGAFPNCTGGGNALQFTTATGVFSCGSSSSGVSSFSGDGALLSNSLSTAAVTATLANAGAHKFWMNNTGISAAPGYQSAGEADLPATTVFTDKANTMGAFLFDLSAGTTKIPTAAGFTAGATSMLGYDSTAKISHIYTNNADSDIAVTTSTSTTTTQVLHATAVAGIYTPSAIATADLPAQYTKFECSPGLGDGLNAITAGTYLQFNCVNKSGVTWTITGISCWTDNAGTSTLNAANNAATGLLTGAVTCNNTKSGGGAAGTQSGTTTLANNDAISFTFVADGTSKQTTWTVTLTQ